MYTPNTQIVTGDISRVQNNFPSVIQHAGEYDLSGVERKYKETNDLFDIQREEADSLSKVLEGTIGKDYQYLNQAIIDSRDRLKNLFKGKKLKDYRTPEFQTEKYNIKNDLYKKKNSSDTSLQQIKEAYAAGSLPSRKLTEVDRYLRSQLDLPPDQRDPDILNNVKTNSLFTNPYDHAVFKLKELGVTDKQIERETSDLILNYDAKYRQDIGYYDDNNNFVFNPSDAAIDRVLEDPGFRNAMIGMLPPQQAKELIGSGNTTAFNSAVRAQTKEFLKTVNGLGPDEKQTGKTVKTWKYYQNATDRANNNFDKEVNVIQQRLLNGDDRAFLDYKSDHWTGFDYEYDTNGKITAVIAHYQGDDESMIGQALKRKIDKEERIPIDPNDTGSIAQAVNIIKSFAKKDTKSVKPKLMNKPDSSGKQKIQGF